MRTLRHLFAAMAVGCVTVFPATGSASPLATSLPAAGSVTPLIADNLIEQIHGWHCDRRRGWYKGKRRWHSHPRACYDDYDDYDDDYTYRPTPNVYIRPVPQIGVYIGGGGHGDWD
jgi:hypothetical protein